MQSTCVVIPAYNAERFLGLTLDSVLSQTRPDWLAVVVDDGSVDGTADIAASYAARDDRVRVLRQANGGVGAARNAGFRFAESAAENFIFLDADDLLEPDAIERLSDLLSSRRDVCAAHGGSRYIDASGATHHWGPVDAYRRLAVDPRGAPVVVTDPTADTTEAMLVVENPIVSSGAVAIRGSAFRQAGGFDPDRAMQPTADWDLWYRLSRLSPLATNPTPTLAYRIAAGSMSTNRKSMRASRRLMRSKWLAHPDAAVRHRVRQGLAVSTRMAAASHARQWATAVASFRLGAALVGGPALAYAGIRAAVWGTLARVMR
jgi:glycosyltransferase involved in cell wall biosynthesis